ncbi:MAG TPA: glycosyltransferase family 4 protein [Microbacterium sp.]|uniref:glycosyltransferase family 4 protein n=1 Tax=Microbacterium sp. TaxID=51671 RepID=UPI002F92D902
MTSPAMTGRTRVLIITGDLIGERMAGPAIRVWNMAEALSAACDVRIVSWNRIERTSDRFDTVHVREADDRQMRDHEAWADVIIVQGTSFRVFPSIAQTQKIVVADLYDPFQLEQLEMNKYAAPAEWADEVTKAVSLLNEQLARADCFLCASEAQRNLWLGGLSSMGRLNPTTYSDDPTFESLLRLVPFGVPGEPPVQRRHGIKGTVPGIATDDKVLIWGGGIYNWFDPVTLVEAMGLLADEHPEIKLFFLSARHFNPDIPEMQALTDTVESAERLGLLDRTVFFNDAWVDYERRADYLLDADIGVSTHLIHAETRFAFRTRILDYLWAELPIVATDGDSFATLIRDRGIGRVVPAQDAPALAAAIVEMVWDEDARRVAADNLKAVREEFMWSRALAPLVAFCTDPKPAPDRDLVLRRVSAVGGTTFERILAMPRGPRRDFALVRHYWKQGGPALVRKKMLTRRERLQRD